MDELKNFHKGSITLDMNRFVNDTDPISGPLKGVKICVIGGGFVGCVAAAGFAKFGHSVVCVEKDIEYLNKLKKGILPFYERDLEDLIKAGLKSGRLSFKSELDSIIEHQKVIFITVGTPADENGRADLKALEETTKALSEKLKPGQIIVIKSTVPIGTADYIKSILKQNGRSGDNIAIINNPEFLREGSAVYDFFRPHRIVLGGDSQEAIDIVKDVYRLGMIDSIPFIITNNKTAEMIKYASNVFLATKIGLINEMARLCDSFQVNILEVANAMGMDARIGGQFLEPGPGWGGSCLPKDLSEIIGIAKLQNINLEILKAVRESNRQQQAYVLVKVKDMLGSLEGKKIAILGLTFKANTSDLRDSPAINIVSELLEERAVVHAFDPAANKNDPRLPEKLTFSHSPYEAASNSHCLLILTEWPDFQMLDWKRIGDSMEHRKIIDMRNILTPDIIRMLGFEYSSMGQL